jgi:hypothetical protein
MDAQGVIAYVGFAMSVATIVVGAINHKRIKSTCCKKEISASLDIENTTPPVVNETPSSSKSIAPA